MKKTAKIKLHVRREVVRALQTKDLRQAEGGNPRQDQPWTSDSHNACCA
jgi:hypothetical protein